MFSSVIIIQTRLFGIGSNRRKSSWRATVWHTILVLSKNSLPILSDRKLRYTYVLVYLTHHFRIARNSRLCEWAVSLFGVPTTYAEIAPLTSRSNPPTAKSWLLFPAIIHPLDRAWVKKTRIKLRRKVVKQSVQRTFRDYVDDVRTRILSFSNAVCWLNLISSAFSIRDPEFL